MGVESFNIVFDNPKSVYMSGDVLKGQIQISISSPIKVNKLTCKIKGKAKTYWEKESGNTTYMYIGKEIYFNDSFTMLEKPEDENLELGPGQYIYDFEFQLPDELPPTYSGSLGGIKYTVSAVLDRPWKLNKKVTAIFVVTQVLDLNEFALINPNIKEPWCVHIEEDFCCCFNRGTILAMIKLPYTGFVRGQQVPITISIENASNVKVDNLRYKISEIQTFFTTNQGYKKAKEERLLSAFLGIEVPCRSSKEISCNLNMPNIPFVNLRDCDIIEVTYKLTFELVVSAMWTLTTPADADIVFGTIQLNDFESIQLLDPPTYDESQSK